MRKNYDKLPNMEALFERLTPRSLAEAARNAYEIIFESASNPLSRAISSAKADAERLTGNPESAATLVRNVRDLVNSYLWDRNDQARDCRAPFKKYYRFLVPVLHSRYHGDSQSNYDLTGAIRFVSKLRGMDQRITLDDTTGKLVIDGGTALTPDIVLRGHEFAVQSRPGDMDPPATQGKYTVTRIDSHAELDAMGLYEYTDDWCICNPYRGEYKYNEYNGAHHSNTCYLIARDGFRDIGHDDPDYPSSLICLFIGPSGSLQYAFNRNNYMVSAQFIESVIDEELQDACPPHITLTDDTLCDRLQAMAYIESGDGINVESLLRDTGRYHCARIYDSPETTYGVSFYEISSKEHPDSRNILFEHDTGPATPPNFHLLYPNWNYHGSFDFIYESGVIIADVAGAIYDSHGHRLYQTRNGYDIGYGYDQERTGLYGLRGHSGELCNLLFISDSVVEVFTKDTPIADVLPGRRPGDAVVVLKSGLEIDLADTRFPVDSDPLSAFNVPDGYDIEHPSVETLSRPVAVVSHRFDNAVNPQASYAYNVIDRTGKILLPDGLTEYDGDEYDADTGIFTVYLAREVTRGEYEAWKFDIDTHSMAVSSTRME